MTDRFYYDLSRLMFDTSLLGTRFTLALAEIIWAITLFWPGDTFARPTYLHMSAMGSEFTWGLLFLTSGFIQMSIAVTAKTDTVFARLFAVWNMAFWSVVVISMYLSVSPPPAAISGEAALAIAIIWICIRPLILLRGEKYAREQSSFCTTTQHRTDL